MSGASFRGVAQRPVGDALDGDVEHGAEQHRDRDHPEELEDGERAPLLALSQAEDRYEAGRGERTEREDVAVREIDQLDDAVDHRVTDGDERVDRAVREGEEQDLKEVVETVFQDARRQQ